MKWVILILFGLGIPAILLSQKIENKSIKDLVVQFKADQKGPYKDIRWFCKDGSTRPPQERCPEPGFQRARYKDAVAGLAVTNHVFLGQILSTTDFAEFLDEDNHHSRLKQYQLESYLKRTDNGWILRKAQYYRGAIQAEDEENWGVEFFYWLLADNIRLKQNFFLLREAARDIPHQGDDNKTQKIRALSKEISDSVPSFLNIRIKIHGQPGPEDIASVKTFKGENKGKLKDPLPDKLDELIKDMEAYYQPVDLNALARYKAYLPKESGISRTFQNFLDNYRDQPVKDRVSLLADLIFQLRREMPGIPGVKARLAMFDISLKAEDILFREAKSWETATPGELMLKIEVLGKAAAGCGYLEQWEWDNIADRLSMPPAPTASLGDLNRFFLTARGMVEWSAGMYRGTYKDVVDLFTGFEPLAAGFIDDKIRSTILLPLGDCTGELGEFIALEAGLSSKVMDIKGQSQVRGLNPGVALGELVVMNEMTAETKISGDKIYVFNHAPADLKPVAGIATVSEGNMVSHVQLLARNLGIPNAVISAGNLEQLKQHQGTKIFYAVSEKGTVIMKPAGDMTPDEKKLFATGKRSEERIKVPVNRLQLGQTGILNLRDVNARSSGILCGPKAANLGQLKQMFPGHVVEGIVIPFGIFKQHMDQSMPGRLSTYWEFLDDAFEKAEAMRHEGISEEEIDRALLDDLAILREAIKSMTLLPEFVDDLSRSFESVFGKKVGSVPVFLRSDTNMEDLKDFTGAGLNLTLFNVLDQEKIIQGIKDVWASPYSERSYKWRQRFLLNPLNVYPSILIIPTVNVDRSGVMITRGLVSGQAEDLTVAFSRGAGGAVEGQAAESWLLEAQGEDILLSPEREPYFTTLPASGGTAKKPTTFENQLLSGSHLAALKDMAEKIKLRMSSLTGSDPDATWDIELGFTGDSLWLFQIRPFVENKNAEKINYLKSISPDIPEGKIIQLKKTL